MMKFNIEERKVEANVDAFIIPNNAVKMKDFLGGIEERKIKYQKLLDLSGIKCDDLMDQKMVQIWLVAKEDLESDNLSDHGFRVIKDNSLYKFKMSGLYYLPLVALEGKKEGDIIDITFPIICYQYEGLRALDKCIKEKSDDWSLSAKITLKQKGYRYEGFGNFEEVLKIVV